MHLPDIGGTSMKISRAYQLLSPSDASALAPRVDGLEVSTTALGVELGTPSIQTILANGVFTDLTGWTIYNSVVPVITDGILNLSSNGASLRSLRTTQNFAIGKYYLQIRYKHNSGGIALLASDSTTASPVVKQFAYITEVTPDYVTASYIVDLTATATYFAIGRVSAAAFNTDIDYIGILNLTGIFGEGNEPTNVADVDTLLNLVPTGLWITNVVKITNFKSLLTFLLGKTQVSDVEITSIKGDISTINDTLNANNKWFGKKLGILGDSQSVGPYIGDTYVEMLQSHFGFASVDNQSVVGSNISRNLDGGEGTVYRFTSRYTDLALDNDLLIVFGGTNDYSSDVALGSLADAPDGASGATFYGAMKFLCEALIEKYTLATLCFMTPLQRGNGYATLNGVGKTLEEYVDVMLDVCGYYSIPVLDLFRCSGVYANSDVHKTLYMPDALHLNEAGFARILPKVTSFVENI